MRLKIVLEPSDEGGYTAYVPTLPGCISEGDTAEEALSNIREAIELYLEPLDDDLAVAAPGQAMGDYRLVKSQRPVSEGAHYEAVKPASSHDLALPRCSGAVGLGARSKWRLAARWPNAHGE